MLLRKIWNEDALIAVVSPKNVFGASTGSEPMASALALQCSTNWAMKTHTLGEGQFVEFIVLVKGMRHEYYVNCGHMNEMKWNEDSYVHSSHDIHVSEKNLSTNKLSFRFPSGDLQTESLVSGKQSIYIPVARDAIPVARDHGNLHLSGTVQVV